MGIDRNINIFIDNKYKEIFQYSNGYENAAVFIEFYEVFSNEKLRGVLSSIHYELNSLFKYLNRRLGNGHYTAAESRQLIHTIEEIKKLKANLKGTEFDFEIDEEYEKKIKECDIFLQESNGSTIPQDFTKIEIIEARPVLSKIDPL